MTIHLLKLRAYDAPYRPEVSFWLSSGDVIMALDRPQIRFQICANHTQMIGANHSRSLIYTHLESP